MRPHWSVQQYKGLGAVVSGIVPKMAIRFSSFEYFKEKLANPQTGQTSGSGVLLAGIAAGATESVLVVTPMVSFELSVVSGLSLACIKMA